jgi:predicted nucleic acid-binding protein
MSQRVAYFDASALAKRYTRESGTDCVNEIFRLLKSDSRACSVIGIAEVTSIFVRKKNDGRIQKNHFSQAMLKLSEEFLEDQEVLLTPVDTALILDSLPLIRRYYLNATDALLLLSVLRLREEIADQGRDLFFVSSDKRLIRAMRTEQIAACDPALDSLEDLRRILGDGAKNTLER